MVWLIYKLYENRNTTHINKMVYPVIKVQTFDQTKEAVSGDCRSAKEFSIVIVNVSMTRRLNYFGTHLEM